MGHFKICGCSKCVAFFHFAAFSILYKKLRKNSSRFDVHGKIRGGRIFVAFLCLRQNLGRKNAQKNYE